MSFSRRTVRRLLLAVASTAAALAAAEAAYRWRRVPWLSPTTHPDYVTDDPVTGWSYLPHTRARHRSTEFDVEIRINDRGLRGPDWPPAGDERPQVLIVGDSIVFGWGVEEADSLPGRLRRDRPDWDVRGIGVSGFGPDQQLLLLRRLAGDLAPDVVVCVSCQNDVYEVASAEMYGLGKPLFRLAGTAAELVSLPGPASWLHRRSLLWRAIEKYAWRQRFARQPKSDDWDLVLALYRAMRDELPSASFILASSEPRLRAAASGERPMLFIDLEAVVPAGGPWFFPVDTHWNEAGHARVAAAVAEVVDAALRARRR